MTKQIPLTQGLFATVDDEDFEYLNQWNWYADKSGSTFYAVRSEGTYPFRKKIRMHRVIGNTPNGVEPDHIDGNGLNNTRANLRNCIHAQNGKNKKKYSNNTSGYKGVYWDKRRNAWGSQIRVDYKTIFLGYFPELEDAARAYDTAAKQYFGEFANTNF